MEILHVMALPFLACLVLVGIHGYLGLHILARGVIFVDLALAQIAALGAVLALVVGLDHEGPWAYWFSVAFTLAGAAMFAALSLGRSWSARSTESVRTWPLSSRTVIAKPDGLDWIFTIGPLLGAAAMGVSR